MNAAEIKGVLIDELGNALPDAQVWLVQDWEARAARTDAEGRYAFPVVKVAVSHLCALKEGHALAGYSGFVVGDAEITLQALPPASVPLRILNRESLPVPAARISVLIVNGQFTVPVDELLDAGFPPLRAEDDGNLIIPFVPRDGFVKFAVSHFQYRDAFVSYLPPRDKVQPIVMYPGTKLQGQVTHGGEAISGARVLMYALGAGGQNLYANTSTDKDGLYGLRLAPGRYQLAVRHAEYASPRPLDIEVPDTEEPVVNNVEMRTPFVVSGSILYPDENGCGGARVQYRHENVIYEETFSGNAGEFEMKVPEKTGELFIIPPPGYQTEKLPVIELNLDESNRRISVSPVRLERLPEISGTVHGPDGKPLPDVLITVSNLTYPIWTRNNGDGTFKIMLESVIEEAVAVRFEHAFRFYRKDVAVELARPNLGVVQLDEFKPALDRPEPVPGRNNLESLLGDKAPDLDCAQWFNGKAPDWRDFKGKTVVLNFWAGFDTSPVGVSRLQEIQSLQSLFQNADDVAFISVHDATSDAEELKTYIEKFGITYPVGLDKEPNVTFDRYKVQFIPQTVLIDRKGKVQYYQVDGRLPELIKALRRG